MSTEQIEVELNKANQTPEMRSTLQYWMYYMANGHMIVEAVKRLHTPTLVIATIFIGSIIWDYNRASSATGTASSEIRASDHFVDSRYKLSAWERWTKAPFQSAVATLEGWKVGETPDIAPLNIRVKIKGDYSQRINKEDVSEFIGANLDALNKNGKLDSTFDFQTLTDVSAHEPMESDSFSKVYSRSLKDDSAHLVFFWEGQSGRTLLFKKVEESWNVFEPANGKAQPRYDNTIPLSVFSAPRLFAELFPELIMKPEITIEGDKS